LLVIVKAEMDTSPVSSTFTCTGAIALHEQAFLDGSVTWDLSQEEIVENEKLWREERDQPELQYYTRTRST
jgi:hypothetical protein